jgi:beta-lactamase regulating signal transducer with metallopeptidase domain
MIPPQLESLTQLLIARILNSLPEGILIAGVVWGILRLLPRQNSGTRFAVWLVALVALIALPFAGSFGTPHSVLALAASKQPVLALPDRWAFILLAGWVTVACFAMLRLVIGIWRLRRLLRSCVPIDTAELDPAMANVVANFSSSKCVTVATSDKLSVPAAIGFVKPKLVVPHWALRELPPADLNTVLLHEFAHIERRDGWTNLFQKIVRAVFCFHPAVWWIERRLSLEREMACDDYVVAETGDPRGYARCLIGLLERGFAPTTLAMVQAAVHRAHDATLRISQILDVNRARTKRVWKPALGLAGVFSLLCLIVMPQTRQLVGFAPNDRATYRDAALPASPEPALVSAKVVPTALHSTRVPVEEEKKSYAPAVSRPQHHRIIGNGVVIAKAKNPPMRTDVVPVRADETAVPITQTVLVIRTANQIGPNSWQWMIAVWRISVVPEPAQGVSVSKKT